MPERNLTIAAKDIAVGDKCRVNIGSARKLEAIHVQKACEYTANGAPIARIVIRFRGGVGSSDYTYVFSPDDAVETAIPVGGGKA